MSENLSRVGRRYPRSEVRDWYIDEPDNSVRNAPRGAQIIQTNQLSTPVFVVLVMALFVAALVAAGALGVAFNANYAAQMAERQSAVARNHADNLEVRVIAMERALKVESENRN